MCMMCDFFVPSDEDASGYMVSSAQPFTGSIQDFFGPAIAPAPSIPDIGSYGLDEAGGQNIHALLPFSQVATNTFRLNPTGKGADIDAVLIGTKWTISNLTFSFPNSLAAYGNPYQSDAGNEPQFGSQFNAAQQVAARRAIDLIESYTNLTITEQTGGNLNNPNTHIKLAQTGSPQVGSARAGFPSWHNAAGDVWMGTTGQPFYTTPAPGNWGWATIFHEIGHSMGLKHGMDSYVNANIAPAFNYSGTLFGMPALPANHDGQAWSLMTYSAAPGQTGQFFGEGFNQPQTYMQNDIAALQYLYGANYNTNSGNTVYTWSPTTGQMFISGAAQPQPTANKIFLTIWDGNGTDTYDLSNYSTGVKVDLRPGEFSTFSAAQLANTTARINTTNLAPGNVGNALLHNNDPRSLIENATGGGGNDTMIGNQAKNTLIMNGGNDIAFMGSAGGNAYGGTGVDTVVGGAGADGVFGDDGDDWLYGFASNDTMSGGNGLDVMQGGDGADIMYGDAGFNYLFGGNGVDTIIGSGGTAATDVNVMFGEGDGDLLYGGPGTNYFYGGAGVDTMYGGAGLNIFISSGESDGNFIFGGSGQNYVYGSSGGDTVTGGTGVDVFLMGPGNDYITGGGGVDYAWGGGGANTFVVDNNKGGGVMVINDFTTSDAVKFLGSSITSFAAVQAAMSYAAGINTTIVTDAAGSAVWLIGVAPSQVGASNFAFV